MSNRQPDANGLAALGRFFFELLAPPAKESVVAWIEKNVEIPVGPITGSASLRPTPYLREPLERIGDKSTRHVTLCFGTQAGKTILMILGMLYRLCRDPLDGMWVLPNLDLAKSFSKTRWQKFVRACPPAMRLVPKTSKGEIDKNLFGFCEQAFLPMTLNLVGSNSPANLSSRPVGLLWLDELEKFPLESKYEAAALQLAEERTKNYPWPLVVKSSTPTLADRMIWTEFLKSDQRHYWLPCPRCEQRIRLLFTVKSEKHGECGVRWWRETEEESKTDGMWDLSKVAQNAYYRCQECGGEVQEFERPGMLEAGVWRPQNPLAEPGRYGYQLSSLYSILSRKTSLGGVAVQFLTSKGIIREMQNFVNSWLAEPWDDARGYELEDVKQEDFTNADIPKDESTPVMGIDFQEGHHWALVRRFAGPSPQRPHGESWLLFADRVDTEEELVALQREYGVAGENVLCDIAWRPNHVGAAILRNDWRGVRGSDTKQFRWMIDGQPVSRIYSVPQLRDPFLGTQWQSRTFKRIRHFIFSKSGALDLVSSLRYSNPPIFHVSLMNVNESYSRHMNARIKLHRINPRTGVPEWYWKNLHNDDHLSDCESFVAIRALQLGLISMPPETSRQSR